MASNAKDGDAATLSEAKFTVTPSAVELSASEEERLRTLGLERRSGVPGLYLLRARDEKAFPKRNYEPVEPAEEVKLEGELKVKAERLRDELAAHLKEKGTEGLPKSRRRGEGDKADLMGAWLSGADLSEAQLQECCVRPWSIPSSTTVCRGWCRRLLVGESSPRGAHIPAPGLWVALE